MQQNEMLHKNEWQKCASMCIWLQLSHFEIIMQKCVKKSI